MPLNGDGPTVVRFMSNGRVRDAEVNGALLLTRSPNEGFHMVEITFECATSGRRNRVLRLGNAALERLHASDVAGFLELARVHAQVAVRRLHEAFQIVERQRLVDGERAENAESKPLVDETVEC